jgi:hypothetical protein
MGQQYVNEIAQHYAGTDAHVSTVDGDVVEGTQIKDCASRILCGITIGAAHPARKNAASRSVIYQINDLIY